jgi:hypothetical protein
LYYNKSKNEFNVKKSENTNFYIPLRWKYIHRKYTNKKDNESKYEVNRYVHFYNPETKEKIHVTETELLNDRDKVIEDNLVKEEVKNMTYEEIWIRILEYIVNYNTTENLIDYNETPQSMILHPNSDPLPPPSPLTLFTPIVLPDTEK